MSLVAQLNDLPIAKGQKKTKEKEKDKDINMLERFASELAEEVINLRQQLEKAQEKAKKFDEFRQIVLEQARYHKQSDALENRMLRMLEIRK